MLESGWLTQQDQEPLGVPSTLQDALTARLDRLGEAKGVAQLAAVIGRDFSLDLLTASSSLPEAAIERSLNQLASKGLIYAGADGSSYRFKHALIQDTAYVSLLKRQRREHHARVARALSEELSQKAEQQPALLAQHYSAAGLSTEAIRSWQEAAAQAVIHSAHREAVQHYRAALKELENIPVTPQSRGLQLTLLLGLGGALHTVRGYAAAEVESVFRQARELCQTAEPSPELFEVLLGLAGYYTMRAQYPAAEERVRQLFSLPQGLLTPPRLGGLHFMASRLNGSQGRFRASLEHAQSVLSLRSSSPSPQEPKVTPSWVQLIDLEATTRGHVAATLWLLGYPDQALASLKQDLAYTATHASLYLRASALTYATVLCFAANAREDAREYLGAFMFLATEQILTSWLPYGQVCLGALQVDSGRAEGIELIRQGLELFDAQGAVTHRPFLLSVYASAQQRLGQLGPAMKTFDEALAHAYKTGELGLEAELHRLKGELLMTMKDRAEAEVLFRQAIAIATRQEAKSFELRALISLASLMHQRGQTQSIKPMLENLYNWFSEGFETRDLREARALLEALSH